jgi:hypothetical protein
MNAISLHQFWASLMEVGAKRIETRGWATSHRGLLAIHASSAVHAYARDEYNRNPAVQRVLGEQFGVKNGYELHYKLVRGAVVCVVDLVDVIEAPALPTMLEQMVPDRFKTPDWQSFGDFRAGRALWLCDNVRRLREPVKAKGRQSFFTLAPEVEEIVRRRI